MGDFLGSPVVRIWCFHCRDPGSMPGRVTKGKKKKRTQKKEKEKENDL